MYAPGDVVANKYRVIAPLGSGGQGEVFRVDDISEGDQVALKILGPTVTPLGPWAEAQILRTLQDDHILPIRNAGLHVGGRMIATEIAENGSLDDRIAASPLGLKVGDALRWTRQACQGIARAHDLNLIHNDIKPGNLFLHKREDCCVADFGFAGKRDPVTGIAPVYGGSPETIAPEVAAEWAKTLVTPPGPGPTATVRSDVYSLAATCYWMLAGRPPHDLSGYPLPVDRLNHVATAPHDRLRDVAPHVPDTIARVVDAALSLDPASRPDSALAFAAALGRPISGRRWHRTDEHGVHEGCWRGAHPNKSGEYVMCLTPGHKATSRLIETRHSASGRKVSHGSATATRSTWATAIRRVMRQVG